MPRPTPHTQTTGLVDTAHKLTDLPVPRLGANDRRISAHNGLVVASATDYRSVS